jgi:WD40 repeat protein
MCRFHLFLSAIKPTWLGVLFAVLIGLGVGFWQWNRPPRPRVVLENLDPDPAFKAYFSPDGRTIGTVAGIQAVKEWEYDYYLTLWETDTGRQITRFYLARQNLDREKLSKVVFSPDGRSVACRYWDQIRVWDIASPEKPVIYDDRDGANHSQLVFSPEGKLLALRQDYELWDVASNKLLKELQLDGERVINEEENTILVWDGDKSIKVWHLPTATLLSERQGLVELKSLFLFLKRCACMSSSARCFLIQMVVENERLVVEELITGKKQSYSADCWWRKSGDIAINAEFIALGRDRLFKRLTAKSWWNWLAEFLGIEVEPPKTWVTLNAFPTGEEVGVLKNCCNPVFSPDGRNLAVTSADGKSLQLWDLPIRKPIGKILGLAALAAVATLLAFNGLGWLRRRRMRLKANLIPNSVPSTK